MAETWDKARKAGALESMLMIRRFEETIVRLFQEEAFMAHYHLYIGQEATGVAVMEALGPDDRIATHHRNHGHRKAGLGAVDGALSVAVGQAPRGRGRDRRHR